LPFFATPDDREVARLPSMPEAVVKDVTGPVATLSWSGWVKAP
jgi:hypothetical protein